TVGHDRRSALHDRLPVGVGHVGDEHVAGLDLVHLRDVADQSHRTRAYLLADGAAGDQHTAGGLELVTLLHIRIALLRLHGFGTRLQDVDLAVDAVTAPLDVHGTLVVLLDDHRIAGQLDDFFVGQREAVALAGGDVHRAHGTPFRTLRVELHLDEFGANTAAYDGILAGF